MIVTAIAGSMKAGDNETTFIAASASVIECATVNADTMPTTGQNASENLPTGCTDCEPRPMTDGNSKQSKNST